MSSVRASSARGQVYAYFATLIAELCNRNVHPLIPGAIYPIDPATGHATMVAPTETTLSAIVKRERNDLTRSMDGRVKWSFSI